MLSGLQGLADDVARKLVVLVLLGVGGYLALEWLLAPPDPTARMQQANPGWTIEGPRHGALQARQGPVDVFIANDDADALRLQPLDCAQVASRLPRWLRLPDGQPGACVRLGEGASAVLVLNHRTPTPIVELWERHFEPTLDELNLPYAGGSSGRGADGPASTAPTRSRTMSYVIHPAAGGSDPVVALLAFYDRADTMLVVTLRPSGL